MIRPYDRILARKSKYRCRSQKSKNRWNDTMCCVLEMYAVITVFAYYDYLVSSRQDNAITCYVCLVEITGQVYKLSSSEFQEEKHAGAISKMNAFLLRY